MARRRVHHHKHVHHHRRNPVVAAAAAGRVAAKAVAPIARAAFRRGVLLGKRLALR